MKSNQKQLKAGVILSYISTGVNMIIQLIYTPVMIKLLGQSDYGLYTLVGSVVSYLSLFNLGFTGAYLRFYSRYNENNDVEGVARLNGMFITVFTCMSITAFICGMILAHYSNVVFGTKLTMDELKRAKTLLQILVVNVALTFPNSFFSSITSAHEKFVFQRILQLLGVLFNPLICLPFLLMGYGSVAVVVVTTFITISKLVVNIGFCLKKLHVPFLFREFDVSLLFEIASFSFFLFLNMIIDQINWSVDKFILGRVSGTTAVAVYGVGSHINSLYTMFSTSISSVFAPKVNRIAAKNKKDMREEFSKLFIKVGRIQFLFLALVASGIIIFGKYFITNIYASSEYIEAYPVSLLLILPVTIPLIQNLGIEIQRSINKHQFRSITYFFMALINIAISIPLATEYGPTGAAMGTLISLFVANGVIINLFYLKVIRLDICGFWKNILNITRGFIIPALLGFFIMKYISFNGIKHFFLWVIIYSAVYSVSIWLFSMNNYEKDLIRVPARKIIERISKKV